MQPTIGRIVHYTLSAQDAEQVNRRRTTGESIRQRILERLWPEGAQAHIGNTVTKGELLPMIITGVYSEWKVSGQVFLDGNDTLFKAGAQQGSGVGCWAWPEIKR